MFNNNNLTVIRINPSGRIIFSSLIQQQIRHFLSEFVDTLRESQASNIQLDFHFSKKSRKRKRLYSGCMCGEILICVKGHFQSILQNNTHK